MKRISFLLIGLITFSLACVFAQAPEGFTAGAPSPTARTTGQGSTPAPKRICARVTVFGDLHLRTTPSTRGELVTYLQHGQIVEVLDQLDSEWWRVKAGELAGYARSLYLEIVECETEEQ